MTHPSPTALDEIRKRHAALALSLVNGEVPSMLTGVHNDRGSLLTHIAALEAELARLAIEVKIANGAPDGAEGRRVGGEPSNELEHFYRCTACGQSVDARQIEQVFHHEVTGHRPMRRN